MTGAFSVFGDYAGAARSIVQTGMVLLVFAAVLVAMLRNRLWRERWGRILRSKSALVSFVILLFFVSVAVVDSIRWPVFEERAGREIWVEDRSLLERIYSPPVEETMSAPFAKTTFEGYRSRPLEGVHVLGTNVNGRDVLLSALKGCRTALIIGGLTLMIVIPLGLLFGVIAGYFGGKTDDSITYTYSVLESVPEILLLICLMKLMGPGMTQLSIALGITSWVGLCRVIRGETFKVRELPYVRGARAIGVSHAGILWRHIVPNVMHIVLIAAILRFSGLVLSEAVLSYLGIGVGPGTGSWGAMIDQARNDLARDPVVWWSVTAAGGFLFVLILAANVFGDRVRDVLDPRLRGEQGG